MRTTSNEGSVQHTRVNPVGITLYDSDGNELTPLEGYEDEKLYSLEVEGVGGGSVEFCAGIDGKSRFKLSKVGYKADAAVELAITGKYKIAGGWVTGGYAWDPTLDPYLNIPAAKAQNWNVIFPGEVMVGTPFMLSIAASGPCNVIVQLTEE